MGKIIITSNGIDSQEIYNDISKNVNNSTAVAIITTSRDIKEKSENAQKTFRIFKKMGCSKTDFVDIEITNPENLLNYNIVWFEGGDPFRLMYWIKKTNAINIIFKLLEKNQIVGGYSAGAMVMGKYFGICNYLTPEMNKVGITDFTGIGLIDINICPHCNQFPTQFENFESKLKQCEDDNNIKILRLYDGQAIIYDNHHSKDYRKITGKIIKL